MSLWQSLGHQPAHWQVPERPVSCKQPSWCQKHLQGSEQPWINLTHPKTHWHRWFNWTLLTRDVLNVVRQEQCYFLSQTRKIKFPQQNKWCCKVAESLRDCFLYHLWGKLQGLLCYSICEGLPGYTIHEEVGARVTWSPHQCEGKV